MSENASEPAAWNEGEEPTADQESLDVTTVAPNLPPEGAIMRVEPPEGVTADDVRVLGYPKYLFDYEVTLSRAFLSDRTVSTSVTVDAITGGKFRNDDYPDLETRTLTQTSCLTPRFEREQARERSRSVIRRYIAFHYPTAILVKGMPETDILQEDLAVALYWLVPQDTGPDPEYAVVDSITGEVNEAGVEPGDVSPEMMQDS